MSRIPHVRGGVSGSDFRMITPCSSCPHAWACFYFGSESPLFDGVFPTGLGVFRNIRRECLVSVRLPHVSGGVSYLDQITDPALKSSQRQWGVSFNMIANHANIFAFPTLVGVLLDLRSCTYQLVGFPPR